MGRSSKEETGIPDMGDDPVLELRDVSVTFEMGRGVSRVVDTVSLDIPRRQTVGIIGESGSGKSMLASTILDAVVEPGQTTGEITYHPPEGEPIDVLGLDEDGLASYRWEEVSMVFQGAMSSFNPTMRIRGHFEETLDRHGVPLDEGMDRARQLLTDLHLNPDRVLASYTHELSGGMRQRALIALALVLDPEVVIMDEPTAALDLLMQRSILSLLWDLQDAYDLTIVFITHDLPLVTDLAEWMAVMYAFELVEIGPTPQVLSASEHPYTRALLRSTPSLDTITEEMEPIPGSSPDPVNPPDGCSYHPRCPMAQEICERDDPGLFPVSEGHTSACFFHEETPERLPIEDVIIEEEP